MTSHYVIRRWEAAALLVLASTALQGCLDALIVGGMATGAVVAADRRQSEVLLGDQRIEFATSSRIGEAIKDQGHVNVTAYNNVVLLTGEVPTAEMKAQTEKIASEVPNVKSVVNEIQISGVSSLGSRTNDSYLTSKVKGNFVGSNKFLPNHVKVVTEAGVVYLMGLVTREEADAAAEAARSTSGVQKVVRVFEYIPAPAGK
jgi:osmotically-inducible protein OsmY